MQYPRIRVYRQIVKITLLTLLGLIITLTVPALSIQPITGTPQAINQPANAQQLLQQGIELYEVERFSDAAQIWQTAVGAFASQGDTLNQALALSNLSLAYQHLGQWQQAEAAITQSLNLLQNPNNITNTQTYSEILAKAYNTQGRWQWAKGQLENALQSWRNAELYYAKANNDTGVIHSLINQARAMQALGASFQAKNTLENIYPLVKQQSEPQIKARLWLSLGTAYRQMGELEKSQGVLQESLTEAEQFTLSNAKYAALLELGNTERALANRAVALSKDPEGQQHTQAALDYYQSVIKSNSPTLKLQAQLNQLSFLIETGKGSQTGKLWLDIQEAIAKLPPSRTTIYAQLNFARSLTCLKQGVDTEYLSCISHLRQEKLRENPPQTSLASETPTWKAIAQIIATALQQAQNLKDQRAESYALGQLGELYELTGQRSQAIDLTQQALKALLLDEEILTSDIGYRWQWQLGRLLEQQGDIKGAIEAYEEAVKTLNSVRSDLLTIDSEVQFSFRDEVEPIHRQLVDLLLRPQGGAEPSQENLQRATEIIDALQLAELENFLRCNLSPTVKLDRDINQVDRQAAFIYPILLKDRLEVLAKLPGQPLKHYATPVTQIEVEKTAIELQKHISKRAYPEVVIEKATQLYQWLIAPLEPDLEKSAEIKTLVFVLDGFLRNIPMSVLYDGQRKEYLMQKQYALALVPGLQLFDLRPLQREKLTVLTAGVSEERKVNERKFDPLPNVVEELQKIGNLVPSQSLLNPQFTQANLQTEIETGIFSAIHIATHGNFSSDPEETYILAYNQLLKSKDLNNLLRTNDQKPAQRVELLVLSACETAQGDNRATLGLAGIAVKSGASSTLATLWQVSDRSTAELMEQFYKELTNPNLTKSQALHQAQLALFKKYKSPYNWAPYVLVGNWL
ncbi:MAG TPA: hypothetical protein DDZ80_19480 [Cyanobacteria bacterium UBA8803]|nr:hypothetical protein [Cyanobacteria bacterium UBA9273]HBL60554.1 hypothetical protein [Cyanobacteria bacterium UBA8803]